MLLLGPDTARGSSAACDRGTYRAGIAKMKAMRERIALQKALRAKYIGELLFFLHKPLECARVPRVAFLAYDLNDCLARKN